MPALVTMDSTIAAHAVRMGQLDRTDAGEAPAPVATTPAAASTNQATPNTRETWSVRLGVGHRVVQCGRPARVALPDRRGSPRRCPAGPGAAGSAVVTRVTHSNASSRTSTMHHEPERRPLVGHRRLQPRPSPARAGEAGRAGHRVDHRGSRPPGRTPRRRTRPPGPSAERADDRRTEPGQEARPCSGAAGTPRPPQAARGARPDRRTAWSRCRRSRASGRRSARRPGAAVAYPRRRR